MYYQIELLEPALLVQDLTFRDTFYLMGYEYKQSLNSTQ